MSRAHRACIHPSVFILHPSSLTMPSLADIANLLNLAPPNGAASLPITGINILTEASPSELSYLSNDRFLNDFANTQAAAVIVQKRVKLPADNQKPVLTVHDA